jgi:hypothetical protein
VDGGGSREKEGEEFSGAREQAEIEGSTGRRQRQEETGGRMWRAQRARFAEGGARRTGWAGLGRSG